MNFLKRARLALVITLSLVVVVEIGVRAAGMTDFPLYSSDNQIGYLIRPNQSGAFLRHNRWAFNDRSMATAVRWNPSLRPNILLIGNSIVMGGDPYDQPQKLGPRIQQEMGSGYSVWPIAVGGWTNVNESVYLERNPDVVSHANFFVWEYMHGGFSRLAAWQGEYAFPRHRPLWAGWYVFRRYALPLLLHHSTRTLPPTGPVAPSAATLFESEVKSLSAATGQRIPGIIFLYPGKDEFEQARAGSEWLPERGEIERIARENHLRILDVSRSSQWSIGLYRGGTHPTVAGNIALSDILSHGVRTALECERSTGCNELYIK